MTFLKETAIWSRQRTVVNQEFVFFARREIAVKCVRAGIDRSWNAFVDGRRCKHREGRVSSTPVILLTGWGRRLVAEGDVPPHVDRVVSKPPDLSELREAPRLLLRNCCFK